MYKVFIYNSPVFFVQEINNHTRRDNLTVNVNISEVFSTGILRIVNQNSGKTIVVRCYAVDEDFKKAFKDFKVIEAAGGYVFNEKGENLYIFRNGFWDLPKGKLEKDETKEEGALREVEEECGIGKLTSQGLLYTTYHVYTVNGKNILKPTYWFKMTYGGNDILSPQLEEGIEKAEWRSATDIEDILNNTFGSIKDVIEKGLKLESAS